MGSKHVKESRNGGRQGIRLGTSTTATSLNCFSRPSHDGVGVGVMRQSASCDGNMTRFMSRMRSRFKSSDKPRPKSAMMDREVMSSGGGRDDAAVPRSTTDQNLLLIDEQDDLLNDVRDKLMAIREEYDYDEDDDVIYGADDEEPKSGFVRIGLIAKSPAMYNLKDVANSEDDDELDLSLSQNSTLSDAEVEASVSSSLTTQSLRPHSELLPPPLPLPPPPPPPPPPQPPSLQAETSIKKKQSLLNRLTRPFLRHKQKQSSTTTPTVNVTKPARTPSSTTSTRAAATTRLSLSDGLIYIDEDNDDLSGALAPPPLLIRSIYHRRRRRSYFIELERTSIAMEQRCLRDNDTLSAHTISYVLGHAPLAQSENTTLSNSQENLVTASRPHRQLKRLHSYDDDSIST